MSGLTVVLGILMLSLSFFWRYLYRFIRTLRVPGPLLPHGTKGHLKEFMLNPHTFGPSMAAKYGPLYRFYNSNFGTQIAIADPTLAQQLHSDQGATMTKQKDAGFGEFIERYIGQCMGLSNGKQWTNIRKVFKTALSPTTADTSLVNIQASLEQWECEVLEPFSRSGAVINLSELVGIMPVRVMFNIFFGHKFVTRHFNLLKSCHDDATQNMFTSIYHPFACTFLYKYFPSKENDTLERYHSNWYKVLKAYESSQEREEGEGGVFDHVLDHITSSSKTEISFRAVADTLTEIIFTNEDVIRPTLCWLLADLLTYPDKGEALDLSCEQNMIDGASLKHEHIKVLHFLRESGRVHPLVPVSTPDILKQDKHIGGFTLPKGVGISIDTFSINFNQKYWRQPFEFQPDRFENIDNFRDKWAAFRFGFGVRNCAGKYHGNLVLANILACMLSRWQLIPLNMDSINHHSQVPIMPDNIQNVPDVNVRVERRKSNLNKLKRVQENGQVYVNKEDIHSKDESMSTVTKHSGMKTKSILKQALSFVTPVCMNGGNLDNLITKPCLVGVSIIPTSPWLHPTKCQQFISFLGALPQRSLIVVGDSINIHNIRALKKKMHIQLSHDEAMRQALEAAEPFFETIRSAIKKFEAERPEKCGWITLLRWTDIEGEEMKTAVQITRNYYKNVSSFKTKVDDIALNFLQYRRPTSKKPTARIPYMANYLVDELPFLLNGVVHEGVQYSVMVYATSTELMGKRSCNVFDWKHDIYTMDEFKDLRQAIDAAFNGRKGIPGTIFLLLKSDTLAFSLCEKNAVKPAAIPTAKKQAAKVFAVFFAVFSSVFFRSFFSQFFPQFLQDQEAGTVVPKTKF